MIQKEDPSVLRKAMDDTRAWDRLKCDQMHGQIKCLEGNHKQAIRLHHTVINNSLGLFGNIMKCGLLNQFFRSVLFAIFLTAKSVVIYWITRDCFGSAAVKPVHYGNVSKYLKVIFTKSNLPLMQKLTNGVIENSTSGLMWNLILFCLM